MQPTLRFLKRKLQISYNNKQKRVGANVQHVSYYTVNNLQIVIQALLYRVKKTQL